MKHRRLDKYVTLYTVCREGGKVIYSYVETLPQHRLQDRSLKEFYRQVEEHGYDVITPSDKDYEQVVKALNVVSKKDAMNDEMSSYNHYKPEEICTCGRWIFFEHMPYYDEKEQKDIVYRSTKKKSSEAQPAKSKEKMASVRVPAYQKESVKRFFDWLKETNASGDSILGAVRAAEYILEDKVAQDSALSEQYKKDLALLKELEEKLPAQRGLSVAGHCVKLSKDLHRTIRYCQGMCTFVGMNQDELDFYKGLSIYILPEGVTDYFELVDFCEVPAHEKDQLYKKELHLYLDEKDNRPMGFDGITPNGFTEEKKILDFPVRSRRTVLHVRRRRWLTAEGKSVLVPLKEAAKIAREGTSYSKELALFLNMADGQ